MKKKFTIEDIEEYLKILNFDWVEKYVYLAKLKKYEKATLCMFKNKPVYLYLQNRTSNQKSLPLVHITNDEFYLIHDVEKMDASKGWVDLLDEKTQKEDYNAN